MDNTSSVKMIWVGNFLLSLNFINNKNLREKLRISIKMDNTSLIKIIWVGNFLLSLTFINNKNLREKLRISKLLILIIESKKVNKSGSQQHNNINLDAFTIIPFSSKTLSHSLFGFIGFIIYKEEKKNLNHENFVEASQKGKTK